VISPAGVTENAAAVKDLLVRLREQGLDTERRYLFVIDGAKTLRAAIGEAFGASQLVQRCRTTQCNRAVTQHDPMLVNQTLSLMRAAWRLPQAEEKHFRRIMGYQNLWSLAGILGRTQNAVFFNRNG